MYTTTVKYRKWRHCARAGSYSHALGFVVCDQHEGILLGINRPPCVSPAPFPREIAWPILAMLIGDEPDSLVERRSGVGQGVVRRLRKGQTATIRADVLERVLVTGFGRPDLMPEAGA